MTEAVYFNLGVPLNEILVKIPLIDSLFNLMGEDYTEEQAPFPRPRIDLGLVIMII